MMQIGLELTPFENPPLLLRHEFLFLFPSSLVLPYQGLLFLYPFQLPPYQLFLSCHPSRLFQYQTHLLLSQRGRFREQLLFSWLYSDLHSQFHLPRHPFQSPEIKLSLSNIWSWCFRISSPVATSNLNFSQSSSTTLISSFSVSESSSPGSISNFSILESSSPVQFLVSIFPNQVHLFQFPVSTFRIKLVCIHIHPPCSGFKLACSLFYLNHLDTKSKWYAILLQHSETPVAFKLPRICSDRPGQYNLLWRGWSCFMDGHSWIGL